jgi:inhibitor of cysteine peptidase
MKVCTLINKETHLKIISYNNSEVNTMKKFIAFLIAITTILVLALQPANLPKAQGLASLESEDQLRRIALALAQRNQNNYYPYLRGGDVAENLAPSLDSKTNNVTQTNTQIQGIDEADTLKSDGEHVYTLFDNVLRMYKIEENKLSLIKTVEFDAETFYAQSMFIVNNQLIVLGSSGGWWFRPYDKYEPEPTEPGDDDVKPEPGVSEPGEEPTQPVEDPDKPNTNDLDEPVNGDEPISDEKPIEVAPIEGDVEMDRFWPGPGNGTPLTQHVYILNKATLNTQHVLKIEGSLIGSRLNGTQLIFVTSKYNWVENNDINKLESEDVLPVITLDNEPYTFAISDIQYINQPDTLNVLTITKFDLSDLTTEFKHLLLDAHTLYMNHDTILLASTSWEYSTRSDWGVTKTHIHSLGYNDELVLKASTSLDGGLLNQFAMDEYKGVVRVALTQWSEKTTNSIVTLDANLDVLDSIKGLAPTESIYSVRFVQDRAYVVTFEQIDPFFVIDMSNPSNIKVLGELKIPGYSTYLHPLSESLVLGFGRDVKVESDGRLINGAMKLSLFDVSQSSTPTEKQNILVGSEYSWGDISYDHKALMVNPSKQLLGFFVTSGVIAFTDGREEYKNVSTYYLISTADESIKVFDEINVNDVYQLKAIMVNDALHLLLPGGKVITRVYP